MSWGGTGGHKGLEKNMSLGESKASEFREVEHTRLMGSAEGKKRGFLTWTRGELNHSTGK